MENRRKYKSIVNLTFLLSALACGCLGFWSALTVSKLSGFLLFFIPLLIAMMGGLLIGGVVSGFLISISIIRRCDIRTKVLCTILFPFTFVCIVSIGILSFIPYYIYNWINIEKEDKIESYANLEQPIPTDVEQKGPDLD